MDKWQELRRPFHPDYVYWKPGVVAKSGDKALALAYADLRAYMERLDELFGPRWEVSYAPWGEGRIIATVTIYAVRDDPEDDSGYIVARSSVGEAEDGHAGNAGPTAEAQAFKRACAMLGLGRYLYNFPQVWAEYDRDKRQFTEAAKAKLRSLVVNHYNRWGDGTQPIVSEIPVEGNPDLMEHVPPINPDGTNDVLSSLTGDALAFVRWCRKTQQVPGKQASEKQLSLVETVFRDVCGHADAWLHLAPVLLGAPEAEAKTGVVSKLIDWLKAKSWDRETRTESPNPEYKPEYVAAVQEAWRVVYGTMAAV